MSGWSALMRSHCCIIGVWSEALFIKVVLVLGCSRGRSGILVVASRHFEPVELLFQPMKGVVADFLARTHGENGLPCRPKRAAAHFAVRGTPGGARAVRALVRQQGLEFLAQQLCDRRLLACETLQRRAQSALT